MCVCMLLVLMCMLVFHVSISIQEHDVVMIPQVKGKYHNTLVLHVGVFFCGFVGFLVV